jgi:NAD(P)-dependent dehydrogenase (short-subunit alcohol dehydrogenase family)
MGTLEGRVALITGGSSGIGRATALEFAREGAAVVIAARDARKGGEVVRSIESAGGRSIFVPTDVSRASDVVAVVARTVEAFGRLDIGFNNAASYDGISRPTADFDEEEFDRTMAVDLKGIWLGMKHEILQMLRQEPRGGAIVNTSSVNGLGGAAYGSLYSAAKAGILGLAKSAAIEYASSGIRVNALAAGAFDTPMLSHGLDRMSGGDAETRRQMESQFVALVPQGRIGDPAEAAKAVVWLCSDAASYVTGHTMIVDGGLTAAMR